MAPHRPNLTLPAVALLAGVLLLAVLSLLPIAVAVGVVQGDIEIGGVAVVLGALLRVATVPVLILVSRRDAGDSVNQVHP